jgi:hypothetical protein
MVHYALKYGDYSRIFSCIRFEDRLDTVAKFYHTYGFTLASLNVMAHLGVYTGDLTFFQYFERCVHSF